MTYGGLVIGKESPERIFAFALTDGSKPHVFDYDIDDDGLASLANLMRSEHILAVIKGRKINFTVESVVSADLDIARIDDRLPLTLDGV